jgi:hypothetical protein
MERNYLPPSRLLSVKVLFSFETSEMDYSVTQRCLPGEQNPSVIFFERVKATVTGLEHSIQMKDQTKNEFLRASAKLRKATVSLVTSVCLSVCLCVRKEQPDSHWMDFD